MVMLVLVLLVLEAPPLVAEPPVVLSLTLASPELACWVLLLVTLTLLSLVTCKVLVLLTSTVLLDCGPVAPVMLPDGSPLDVQKPDMLLPPVLSTLAVVSALLLLL